MARGTASGRDAALRPRGKARVARTGRRRRIGRGHVVGDHAIMRSTWAPVWGATWQEATRSCGPRGRPYGAPRGRVVSGGPTGIVGPG